MEVPKPLIQAINSLVLPAQTPEDPVREVSLEDFDLRLRRRGSQLEVTVPSRDAESAVREIIEPTGELDRVGSKQGFMVTEERGDGTVEMRIQRSSLIELAYA